MRMIQKRRQRERPETLSVLPLLYLLCGIWGLLRLLHSLQGISFSMLPPLLTASVLCSVLYLLHRISRNECERSLQDDDDDRDAGYVHSGRETPEDGVGWRQRLLRAGRRFAYLVVFGGIAACTSWYAFVNTERLTEELDQIAALLQGTAASGGDVTAVVTVYTVMLALVLYVFEFCLGRHDAPWLLTTVLLLAGPLAGIRPDPVTLFLMVLYQLAFLALHVGWWRASVRQTAAAVGCLLAIAFFLAGVLSSAYSGTMTAVASRAEQFVQTELAERTGQAERTVSGGKVHRGNSFPTGTVHLTLTATRQPTETLYLKGFSGGEYTDSTWLPFDDLELFERLAEDLDWQGMDTGIAELYYEMYGSLGSAMLWMTDQSRPVGLWIHHESGQYWTSYRPYCSVREENLESQSVMQESGYMFWYSPRSGMQVDWERVRQLQPDLVDMLHALQDACLQELPLLCTAVPVERLPRLTALVEENPLEDLDEITAFILHTLNTHAVYTRTPGWAPLNEDIVESFLFDRHQGYCEHFASAATLMYRLYGIPARYATGYAVPPSAFSSEDGELWTATVTDEDAHAWPEIFLEDCGWLPVEVTPAADGSTVTAYPGFDTTVLETVLEQNGWSMELEVSDELPAASVSGQDSDGAAGESFFSLSAPETDDTLRRQLRTVLLCVLLMLPLVLLCRRLARQQKRERADSRQIFRQLLDLLAFCGIQVDTSAPDLAVQLHREIPAVPEETMGTFVETVRREAWGPPEPAADNGPALQIYRTAVQTLPGRLRFWKRPGFWWRS